MKPKVGRNFTSERGEGVKGEVKNISLHWLQGIFETVPNSESFFWDLVSGIDCGVHTWRTMVRSMEHHPSSRFDGCSYKLGG